MPVESNGVAVMAWLLVLAVLVLLLAGVGTGPRPDRPEWLEDHDLLSDLWDDLR